MMFIYIKVLIPYFVGRYQIPAVFFTPNTRLNNLLHSIPSALLCGFHYTPDVSYLL